MIVSEGAWLCQQEYSWELPRVFETLIKHERRVTQGKQERREVMLADILLSEGGLVPVETLCVAFERYG